MAVTNITFTSLSDWGRIDIASGGQFEKGVTIHDDCNGNNPNEWEYLFNHMFFRRSGCNVVYPDKAITIVAPFQSDGSIVHFRVSSGLAGQIQVRTGSAWCGSIAGIDQNNPCDMFIDPAAL